jgi:predicted RNA binding protein YcfA (HicA-like mRNA interferase family)
MRPSRLLQRLFSGAFNNVEFPDAQLLVGELGFIELRVSGSHHIFVHPGIPNQLYLQNHHGQAKPYQLRQLIALVRRYNLTIEKGKE